MIWSLPISIAISSFNIEHYVEALNDGGSLLLSGFLEADAPLIEARAEELGLRGTNKMCDEGWVCLTFRK